MEYEIILPEVINDEWHNVGIDFGPQTITGVIKGENIDKTIIDLKRYCLSLDNRFLRSYKIIREQDKTIIRITV